MAPPRQGQLVHVRIPDDDLAWIDQAAAIRDFSRAAMIRAMLAFAQQHMTPGFPLREPPAALVEAVEQRRRKPPRTGPSTGETYRSPQFEAPRAPGHTFKPQPSRPLHCETCGIPKGKHP